MTTTTEAADRNGHSSTANDWSWSAFAWVTMLAVLIFALRVNAPPNLLNQDQERPAAYVFDVVKNGNWLCQRDLTGDVTSKPPFYTWVGALVTLAAGQANVFTLYLPGALAAWGTGLLVLGAGRRRFGPAAGLFAVLACFLCTAGLKQFGLARTDAMFTFTVTATALLAYRAWTTGRGWTAFWFMAGIATLTKGPLGLVLGAGGLLAALWERRSGKPHPLHGAQWPGILLYLALTGGWFALAYWHTGQPLIDKMVGRELVGHMAKDTHGLPGSLFWRPPLYYLGRAAPWSLLAYWGLWRVFRHPSPVAEDRRFERFLFCWFAVGLTLFSLSTHQRADLLWPLMPAAALLAGRELARLTEGYRPEIVRRATVGLVLLAMAGFAFYYLGPRAKRSNIPETIALRELARQVAKLGGRELPLTHVDSPMTLQFYLNTFRPPVSAARAAALLRGPDAVLLALADPALLDAQRLPDDPPLHAILPLPSTPGPTPVRIVSNRPGWNPNDPTTFAFGGIEARLQAARIVSATARGFVFQGDSASRVTFTNTDSQAIELRVRWETVDGGKVESRLVEAGTDWTSQPSP
ncbi:MAG: ArnT family glycosyltransferase [Limisphaerales bacterium]